MVLVNIIPEKFVPGLVRILETPGGKKSLLGKQDRWRRILLRVRRAPGASAARLGLQSMPVKAIPVRRSTGASLRSELETNTDGPGLHLRSLAFAFFIGAYNRWANRIRGQPNSRHANQLTLALREFPSLNEPKRMSGRGLGNTR